jgi:hypothetical protein
MHPSQIPPLREPLCWVHQVGLAPDCTGKDGKSIREPGTGTKASGYRQDPDDEREGTNVA